MPTAVPYHRESDSESDSGSEGPEAPSHDYAHRDDSPDSVQELDPIEIPDYFLEHNGRLFHSSLTAPYPLPVDTPEQERLNALNTLVKHMIGARYTTEGPVPQILAQEPDKRKQALDVCHGTGKWVMEMAENFPHVLFTGVDIVPIATRYPLPNVTFEVGDIIEEFRWSDSAFDFVHARDIALSVRDYRTILPDVARVLRSGGVFFSGEWELKARHQLDSRQPAGGAFDDPCPLSRRFFQVVNAALESRGILTDVSLISGYLHDTGDFHHIQSSSMFIPVGGWHDDPRLADLGAKLHFVQTRFADSIKPLLRQMGNSEDFIEGLTSGFVNEIGSVVGIVAAFHYVYAIRI
ncbi:hypothetical protein AGABI2DRAFT_195215 [Agaricus bisporus var. bisporus H97]|uniref:hypothetical protein n=1 Tax=Agaricus bisporus var. bisporus (strain H97 / ATCC MYA-4626 / FGSC 10389) TaxID=936046 RepID=UPI00029F7D84|nr:hypothetical protein AGABI2DRAFT_195215 [Agaricus bisporus var. bisporus H97]EKV43681.1 hypothetical protein AGABI2DRAFT_195215 [Agaricus bisporus var. bisporus H97]